MKLKYAHLIRLISLVSILCSPFATVVRAAPMDEQPPPYLAEPSLAVFPAWATSSPPSEKLTELTLSATASQTRHPMDSAPLAPMDIGDVIEVFTNTWSYSTLGLVYDPGRDHVRYVHESQSSSHNPTIYDVEYVPSNGVTRTVLFSVALSTKNSGWPWQIDNRTGAGYDFVADTYFLPDYNGDLSYADDNIVEIRPDGTILNAWEMDDEVGSNDSADGSEIDSIIDIAVVPGNPTRYFATAAYDDNVVYEIELTKTGAWWTPNSWRTVATCTVPGWSVTDDNLGIDYDAENERLYHSSWHTTTIVATDLTCQNGQTMTLATDDGGTDIQPFDCPGAGGYNTGVTFIEGADPPEVWVTDFDSDKTTRCEAPGGKAPPAPGWEKWIDDARYDTDITITRQLSDVIRITDVITAVDPFTLTETWDPEHLTMVDLEVYPPAGQIVTGAGSLQIIGAAGPPEIVTVTKWFHIEPCTWTVTTLQEELEIELVLTETRPVTIEKRAPILELTSAYGPDVSAGSIASFTLVYSNAGGYENDVWISNTFPITAPIVYADPFPNAVGPDGTWARWDVGDLANGDQGEIDVYVFISETLPSSTTITIWDGIYNHVGVLEDETEITYHVITTTPPSPIVWEKRIDGDPWRPGLTVTVETTRTFRVTDTIYPNGLTNYLGLIEEWNPDNLSLVYWDVFPVAYRDNVTTPYEGFWSLVISETWPLVDPITVTKEFHVEPCTWTETILWESLAAGLEVRHRPVLVNKQQPNLRIDSSYDEPAGPDVYSREEATFTLAYSNTGGYESDATITNVFPPEARFARSDPLPDVIEGDDITVTWWITEGLGTDERGAITVTVLITEGLPPSTTIEIWDGIFNHAGELQDETFIDYHVPEPDWEKWVNGISWDWDMDLGATIETSDTITVTDVISTRSAIAMVEHWNPERLALMDYVTEATASGIVLSDTGFLSWEFPEGAPGTVTITKWFHVEPCTWTYTVLWEELWVEDVEWERRPVHIDKIPPDLHLESDGGGEVYAGRPATFTLVYWNAGGYENDAWITNTFPITAPFVSASLTPTQQTADGTRVAWRLGDLETGEEGAITVTVAISESLVASDTVEIWDGIFHDGNNFVTETVIFYHVAPPPTWTKWIDGEPWTENVSFTVETSDTVEIVDVVSAATLFELTERWNPDELALADWAIDPPVGEWFTETGAFFWHVPPAGPDRPDVVTLTKRFHVEPCTWTTTILEEELWVDRWDPPEWRSVFFEKLQPELQLDSEPLFGGQVFAGGVGRFTLVYSNTGGRENDVVITNTFPVSATFAWADPWPDHWDAADGRWARWELGELDQGDRGLITVTVDITETLEPGDTVEVWDGIYNHVGELISDTVTRFYINAPPPITWYKEISRTEWTPDFRLPVETTSTFTVTDIVVAVPPVDPSLAYTLTLAEFWDPAHLDLIEAWVESDQPTPGEIISDDGWLDWVITPPIVSFPPEPITYTLVKVLRVKPCTWAETWLREDLFIEDRLLESRPVRIVKRSPELWLQSEGGGDVQAGDLATFTLIYSNTGGYENDVWIWNEFPPVAPFVSSEPPATISATNGITAAWDLGDLENGDRGTIDVAIAITESLMTSETIEIWDGIYNHAGELKDETVITYHVACPPYTWTKWITDEVWYEDISVTVQTSDTLQVVDVITTDGFFELIEAWDPARLHLEEWAWTGGEVITEDGRLTWHVPPAGLDRPAVVTLTKWFYVEPCTWTETLLREELWLQGESVEKRPVIIHKPASDLWLDGSNDLEVLAGQSATFTLHYGNAGGRENDVRIESEFPLEAPFVSSIPTPTGQLTDGTWAMWNLGILETEAADDIQITVAISEGLVTSDTVDTWHYIYDHLGRPISATLITYHVTQPPYTWTKWIDDVIWREGVSVTVETSDTVRVVDVISTASRFELIEGWDTDRLRLEDWALTGGEVITEDGQLIWHAPFGEPQVVTLTKWFYVEPCTWTETLLWEELWLQGEMVDVRPVTIHKLPADLWLEKESGGDVYAGGQGRFTLYYGNAGGRENDVVITNTFPISAPFAWSDPWPECWDEENGRWARWEFDYLEQNQEDAIEVTINISETLPPSTTVEVWDDIYDHLGRMISAISTSFHITTTPPITWQKWISDAAWYAGISFTVETSDTITVIDVISADRAFDLYEEWDPEHLDLLESWVDGGSGEVISDDGWLRWTVTPTVSGLFTLTKIFHVAPCTWTETWLWEDLLVEGILLESRPVRIEKWRPELWLESEGGGEVYAGDLAAFTLIYSNTGGREHDVWIENVFPPEAPFVSSNVTPTQVATDATWVRWDVGDLAHGARGEIDVTVLISDALTPCNWITITDWIYNHVGEPVDETVITYHVVCKELTAVTLTYTNTGDIYTDTVVYFEADLAPDDATRPYSYTIDYGDGISRTDGTDDDPMMLTHTFDTTSTYTVEIAARNCDMVAPVTDTITVTVVAPEPPPQCIPITKVDLTLDTASTILIDSIVRFRADIAPDEADKPYTYTIDYDDGTITTTTASADPLTLAHTYAMTGAYTVEIAAWNCDVTKPVTDSLTLTVHPPGATFSHIYLPLVMRGD